MWLTLLNPLPIQEEFLFSVCKKELHKSGLFSRPTMGKRTKNATEITEKTKITRISINAICVARPFRQNNFANVLTNTGKNPEKR